MSKRAIGRDCELSTTGIDPRGHALAALDVTRAVLGHIGAAFEPFGQRCFGRQSVWSGNGWSGYATSSDCLRHWAPNGQCFYCDMGHVEVCTAETYSPRSYAAQCFAALSVAEQARRRAQAAAPPGTRYRLSTANVDMLDPGISWGTHVNLEVSRELWEDLFVDHRHPARLSFVASSISAATAFFGCGYLLPLRDGEVVFSLSARAHHIQCVETLSTTEAFRRGLLNSRREPHASQRERLHLISFDFSLAGAALQAAFLQCCIAAAEQGRCELALYDPVDALHRWSFGLDIATGLQSASVQTVDGRQLSLPEYVSLLGKSLLVLHGEQALDVSSECIELLTLVVTLADQARAGDVASCARHLDWAAKLLYLLDLSERDSLPLASPQMRLADHDFTDTDPEIGAFWRLWRGGFIDPLITQRDVDACLRDGPAETRAWARGRLIQRFAPQISDVNWGYVEIERSTQRWAKRLLIEMPATDSLRRSESELDLTQAIDVDDLERRLRRRRDASAAERDPLNDLRHEVASSNDSQPWPARKSD